MTRPAPHIAQMAKYALADMQAPPGKPLISLSQNESLRPPSPKAIAAAQEVIAQGALYPDPDWGALRAQLGALHDVSPQAVLCGAGSLDLIGAIARVYAGPSRAVLVPAHAYPFFRSAAQMAGARVDLADEGQVTVSVEALLHAVQPDTGVVFVANPGNPTGTRISKTELLRLRAGLREDILLVVDEAYGEFADHLGEPCFDMVSSGNTVVLRTFSKAYALAGFRVGWGAFPPEIAAEVRKVLNPNNISGAAQAAATAAAADQAYMRESCALTAAGRDWAVVALRAAGFKAFDSFTNFVLIDLGDPARAGAADAALKAEGVFLRPQAGAGLPQMLRMTVGTETDMQRALDVLTAWQKGETT